MLSKQSQAFDVRDKSEMMDIKQREPSTCKVLGFGLSNNLFGVCSLLINSLVILNLKNRNPLEIRSKAHYTTRIINHPCVGKWVEK